MNFSDQQRQIAQKSDDVGMKNLGRQPEQMSAQDRQRSSRMHRIKMP